MTRGSLPNTDASLLTWSLNFAQRLEESYEELGISQQQMEDYLLLHQSYMESLRLATDPSTRTKSAVAGKNTSRTQLKDAARRLISIINGQPNVSEGQKINLGINVSAGRTRIQPPEEKIVLLIQSVVGRRVKFEIKGELFRKPKGVYGAVVYTFIGENPENESDFKFQGITTRNVTSIDFPADIPPGGVVWITARWFNPRGVMGKYSVPVSTNLQGGLGRIGGMHQDTKVLKAA